MVASIIITTYNRPELLKERSLRSALAQDFDDYEIIVIDDCSDVPYNVDVKYIRNETNIGLSASRNKGIKEAKGKYVVCLDDDNELLPDFLKKTVAYLEANHIHAVGAGRIIQYKDFAHTVVPGTSKFSSMDWGWLIRKEVFDAIQYDENLRANEDTDFAIRFSKIYSRDVLSEPLCIAYDVADPKLSLSFPNERELKGMEMFFNKNLKEYEDPKELWCLYRLMGRKFYRGGYKLRGIGYFWKGFTHYLTLRSFVHAFLILFGWGVYDAYMTLEEKISAEL